MKSLLHITLILLLMTTSYGWASVPPEGVSSEQWISIQQHIAASKYRPQPLKDGYYTALNAAQGWQVKHAPDGMTTLKNDHFSIGMKLNSIGSQQIAGAPKIEVKDDNLYYYHSPTIKEWWVNSADKTEQWFSLRTRPITGNHEIKVGIELDTNTTVTQVDNQLVFTANNGQKINYDRLKVWDAHGKVLPSRMQLADGSEHFNLIVDDRLATYPITIDPSFTQQNYLKPAVVDEFDLFGLSLDIDGSTMVVGSYYEDSAATTINGDSSDNSSQNSGAAYVFVRSGLNWVQQAYLKPSNNNVNDNFGRSVGISGNTVVVGSPNDDSLYLNSGAVYVYTRNGTTWSEQTILKSFVPSFYDYFGHSVAIEGDTIAVGAYGDEGDANSTIISPNDNAPNSGAVHVFTRNGVNWSQEGYLKASNAESFDELGSFVDINGETIVAAALGEDGDANSIIGAPNNAAADAGAVYIFVRDGVEWTQQNYLKAHNAGAEDGFGNQVAVDGDTVVVGAHLEDGDANSTMGFSNNNAIDAGAAYVYVRENETWTQQAYLKASNADSDDEFGFSVAIAGETVAVGSPFEAGDAASSISQPNNNIWGAGAAYVFSRNDTEWIQKQYLKADHIDTGDYFGSGVAINSGNILVSAFYEDGDASSTSASPNNNTINSGAVYLFTGRYFVGGKVFGLPFGGPLDLLRNGSEILTITDNGAYEFLTDVSANNAYTVSISSVPPGYICSIINASGSVGYDDVTDANVYCSTNSYSVGGTVSGLTGTGLVLRNNDVYDVIINSNGSFTFSPELANGTPYNVVIQTQPSGGETCSITNGSGTITGGDANVSVVCVGADYDIGGTVSGLTGTLVIQNNGGDDLTITNNGSFTFDTPVTDGNPYMVTVQSQPNAQTCTVTNSSGTVSGADVTNIEVTCNNNLYNIGGTVTGLTAAGLVLQNNGGDDLTISGNGSFTFNTALLDGSAYTVSVLSQPNGQSCSLVANTGTVSGADVTNIVVSCVEDSFFIGGSVSGLSTIGLVLQNNGGDDLNITTNGGFVFSQPLINGNNYHVTVANQPNEQVCTVSNATGVINGQDVIDVDVNCVDLTYLIGVNVSGLTGPGLVLQNNGSDNLSISHNGVSPFDTELTNGSSYNVTIFSQPDDVGNTCETVGVSSGMVSGGHVLIPVVCGNDLIFKNGFDD